MLFAGTTEGRKLCEYLTGKNCDTYVYVTTEYGRELLPQADNVHIHTGRMDEADMLKELEAKKPYIVIDATHPYATQVTHNIKNVCDSKNISYVRVLREDNDKKPEFKSDNITYVKSWFQVQLFRLGFFSVTMRTDSNAKRYHPTLSLMGATRLASGKYAAIITQVSDLARAG